MIKGVKFVSIPVADQARALAFYTEKLGFTKARGVEFTAPPKKEPWGTSVIFKDSEGNQIHLGSR